MSEVSVQRRLAAILAADVVGYSAMMERAEEATFARIGRLRRQLIEPSLARHQGRLIKTTGDGFFAEFASPVAALRCAVEIQDQIGSGADGLRLRMGLNLANVIVDEQGDVFGDGINIAARLEGIADPGGIVISSKVYGEVKGNLDIEFEDRGEQQLKNIKRPIRTYAVGTKVAPASSPARLAAAFVPSPMPERPSIAVLPFQNMSGDPEQEYFADGIVEDVIAALSRFRSLLVIARNTSFTYKGKAVDIRQVGRDLDVRYVVEGSVRKAGGRVRITGQLIEASSGAHLWADKIDGALEDVFELQDQVTSSVVGAIAPAMQLAEAERSKRKPTANLDSYDLLLRGMAKFWSGRPKEAADYFRKAIQKDDQYAEAYGMFAGACLVWQSYGMKPIPAEERAEALRCAKVAASLGNNDAAALARAAQAIVYFGRDCDRGTAMIDRAVALNPNMSSAWQARGWIYGMCGKIEEAMSSFSQVLQFSELDPNRIGACSGMSWGYFHLGKYEEGCAWATKALQKGDNALYLFPLIINSIGAGRRDEARRAAARLQQLAPSFRVSQMNELFFVPATHRVLFEKAVGEAGVPE
jgi:adenylate cyclase